MQDFVVGFVMDDDPQLLQKSQLLFLEWVLLLQALSIHGLEHDGVPRQCHGIKGLELE